MLQVRVRCVVFSLEDDRFILPPSILSLEVTGPYSAQLVVEVNKMTWPIENLITGFVVGICSKRTDDLPNMNHVDLEVFVPSQDILNNHQATLTITQLKPNHSYQFNVCCLFAQGRTSSCTSNDFITTPPTPNMDTYLWSKVRVKINQYVYDNVGQMQKIEGFNSNTKEIDLEELETTQLEENIRDYGTSGNADVNNPARSRRNRIRVTPVSNSDMKELLSVDMLLNTQTRELILRKKSKDIGRYDLCRVVNARFFPDSFDHERDYIRLIVSMVWEPLVDPMGHAEAGLLVPLLLQEPRERAELVPVDRVAELAAAFACADGYRQVQVLVALR